MYRYFAYRLPANMKYAYSEGASADDLKTLQSSAIDSDTTSLYHTLNQLYTGDKSTLSYAVYNDENPDGTTTSGGMHGKGAIATDKTSGFWLIQSLPKYPDMTSEADAWSKSAPNFGQHCSFFFCF